MKVLPVLIALGVISVSLMGMFQSSNDQLDAQFTNYMTTYDKSYHTEDEYRG